MIKSIYIIGSLRNEKIPDIANMLESVGIEPFADWYGAGPEADDKWKEYEQSRGRTYEQALDGYAAWNVFNFDKTHLDRCDAGLLVMPAGKSGHLELGYLVGSGKPGFILMDDPDRWDVMVRFATKVFFSEEKMLEYFRSY